MINLTILLPVCIIIIIMFLFVFYSVNWNNPLLDYLNIIFLCLLCFALLTCIEKVRSNTLNNLLMHKNLTDYYTYINKNFITNLKFLTEDEFFFNTFVNYAQKSAQNITNKNTNVKTTINSSYGDIYMNFKKDVFLQISNNN